MVKECVVAKGFRESLGTLVEEHLLFHGEYEQEVERFTDEHVRYCLSCQEYIASIIYEDIMKEDVR